MMVTVEVVMEVFERLVDDDVDEVERVGMIMEVTEVHIKAIILFIITYEALSNVSSCSPLTKLEESGQIVKENVN